MHAIQLTLVSVLAGGLVVIGLALAAQAGTAPKLPLTARALGILAGVLVVGLGALAYRTSPYA